MTLSIVWYVADVLNFDAPDREEQVGDTQTTTLIARYLSRTRIRNWRLIASISSDG